MTNENSEEYESDHVNDLEKDYSRLKWQSDETTEYKRDSYSDEVEIDDELDDKKEESKTSKLLLVRRMSEKIKKYKHIKRYWSSIFVRLMFMSLPSFHIYLLSCIYSNQFFFFCIFNVYIIVILIDGIYVLIKKDGYDHYWFSISFAFYTMVMIFVIVHEIDYKYEQNDIKCETNATQLKYIKSCGKSTNENKSICTLVEIIVIVFLSTLVLGRWIMPPSKRMDKEDIYFQIYKFTTLSADVIEISQLMQDEDVAESYAFMKACQLIFAISLLQFSFSPAAIKQRNMKLTGFWRVLDIFLSTEAWSHALSLFTQELPCFVLRVTLIYSIVSDLDYSLTFFALKNGLMIFLLIIRIFVVCWIQAHNESRFHKCVSLTKKFTLI